MLLRRKTLRRTLGAMVIALASLLSVFLIVGDRLTREEVITDGRTSVPASAWSHALRYTWQDLGPLRPNQEQAPSEAAPAFDHGSRDLIFARKDPVAGWDLMRSRWRPEGYVPPEPLFELNTLENEVDPRVVDDGRTLLFASNRPGGLGGYDVYRAERNEEGFLPPVRYAAINSAWDDRHPTMDRVGSRILLASNRLAIDGVRYDIFESLATPNGFGAPQLVQHIQASDDTENRAPTLTPDGRFLFFASDRPGGEGGYDLYRSLFFEGRWQPPEPLRDLNTPGDESDPGFSSEGTILAYTRTAPDGDGLQTGLWLAERRELVAIERDGDRFWTVLMYIVAAALLALALTYLFLRWNDLHPFVKFLIFSAVLHLLFLLFITSRTTDIEFPGLEGDRAFQVQFISDTSDSETQSAAAATGDVVTASRRPTGVSSAHQATAASAPDVSRQQLQDDLAPRPSPARETLAKTKAFAAPTSGQALPRSLAEARAPSASTTHQKKSAEDASPGSAVAAAARASVQRSAARARTAAAPQAALAPAASAPPGGEASRLTSRSVAAAEPRHPGTLPVVRAEGRRAVPDPTLETTGEAPPRSGRTQSEATVPAAVARAAAVAAEPPLASASKPSGAAGYHLPSSVAPEGARPSTDTHTSRKVLLETAAVGLDSRQPVVATRGMRATVPRPDLSAPAAGGSPTRRTSADASPGLATAMVARSIGGRADSAHTPPGSGEFLTRGTPQSPAASGSIASLMGSRKAPESPGAVDSPSTSETPSKTGRRAPAPSAVAARSSVPAPRSPGPEAPARTAAPESPVALNVGRDRPALKLSGRVSADSATASVSPVSPRAADHSGSALQPRTSGVPLARLQPGFEGTALARSRRLSPPRSRGSLGTATEGRSRGTTGSTQAPGTPGSAVALKQARKSPQRSPTGHRPRSPGRGLSAGNLLQPSARGLLKRRSVAPTAPARAAPPIYAKRSGPAKLEALKKAGGTAETEAAVLGGLRYLAGRQRSTGAWGKRARDRKYGDVRVGKTGLALLAFLGSGHTHKRSGEFRDVVTEGIGFLISQQDEDGGHLGDTSAYSHGIATYALAEAYAMTRDKNLKKPLERAVQRIRRAQVRRRGSKLDGGWSYFYRDEDRRYDSWPRLSVSVWQIMALESARIGGLVIPDAVLTRARRYVLACHDRRLDAFRYNHDPEWLQTSFPTLPGSTSAALFAMELLGVERADHRQETALAYVMDRIPDYPWKKSTLNRFVFRGQANEYFLYYATLGLRLRGGAPWTRWNQALQDLLLPAQQRDGSWVPVTHYQQYVRDTNDDRSYTTAMCVLMLEVYYRYDTPLLQAMARTGSETDTLPVGAPEVEAVLPQGVYLFVDGVRRGSNAADAGLRRGDVILSLGGKRVGTIDQLRGAIASPTFRSGIPISIIRNKRARTLTLEGSLQGLTVEER